MDDFREPSLNINDDRKIKINLGELMKEIGSNTGGESEAPLPSGEMILLTVKCFKP